MEFQKHVNMPMEVIQGDVVNFPKGGEKELRTRSFHPFLYVAVPLGSWVTPGKFPSLSVVNYLIFIKSCPNKAVTDVR